MCLLKRLVFRPLKSSLEPGLHHVRRIDSRFRTTAAEPV